MKLVEIAGHIDDHMLKSKAAISGWMKVHMPKSIYSFGSNLEVKLRAGENMRLNNFANAKLPIKFIGDVNHIELENSQLETLRGLPMSAARIYLNNCEKLNSLEGLPKKINNSVCLIGCKRIISLEGIGDIIEEMGDNSAFVFEPIHIKRGGLGFLNVKGDFSFDLHFDGVDNAKANELRRPFTIIKSYLNRKDDIFECQAELIEAGYEEFAKL